MLIDLTQQTDKLLFVGMPPRAMRARCGDIRYCPAPLGIVTLRKSLFDAPAKASAVQGEVARRSRDRRVVQRNAPNSPEVGRLRFPLLRSFFELLFSLGATKKSPLKKSGVRKIPRFHPACSAADSDTAARLRDNGRTRPRLHISGAAREW